MQADKTRTSETLEVHLSSSGALVQNGHPTPQLKRAVVAWGKIGLIVAAVIAALGGATYLFAAAIGLLGSAIVALAAGIVLLAKGLVGCAIGVFLLLALGAKK